MLLESGPVKCRAAEKQQPQTFTFKVDGDKLTGTMTGPQGEVPLQEGKVSGDQISFATTGGNAKILFNGTVAGDEIKMTAPERAAKRGNLH